MANSSYDCAIVLVNLALPKTNAPRSRRFEACIDSGASSCLFHAAIGRAIGLDVHKGEVRETLGIHGRSSIFMHDIALYAPGGIIYLRAGFSEELPILGLLGMCGFFDHFKIAFDPTASACTLDRLFLA